jgi:SAM-dependent methyltransferase
MNLSNADDLQRLRRHYAGRRHTLAGSDRYSPFNPAHLFAIQQRQRAVLALLRRHGLDTLGRRQILELGCGSGGVLLELLGYGAAPRCLHGTDLLLDRVVEGHTRLPHLPLSCSDGQHLPYAGHSFDLVLQYTVFSSVLDDTIKANLAREMRRVLRPGGAILWYDFWLNPTNRQTRGIRPAEIRRLFPNCRIEFQRITLAPPLTRGLIRLSWILCQILEKINVFNTHYLALIRPNEPHIFA